MSDRKVVKVGDTIIFEVNGEKKSIFKISAKNKQVRLGKTHVSLDPVVGKPFGAVFALGADNKTLEQLTSPPTLDASVVIETEKNNSTLCDRNEENQRLTKDEIDKMKQEGKAGAEIIEALASSSATFDQKTEFSQEKWKRKKAKKYCATATVRRPTAQVLCEAYYEKHPDTVWNLRYDTLSMLLSFGNVGYGAKVLVSDSCAGLVAAAVMERLGGQGAVVATYVKHPPALECTRHLNLTQQERSVLHVASLSQLRSAKDGGMDTAPPILETPPPPQLVSTTSDAPTAPEQPPTTTSTTTPPSDTIPAHSIAAATAQHSIDSATATAQHVVASATATSSADAAAQRRATATAQRAADQRAVHELACQGFTSCILASPALDPASALAEMLPLLRSSAPIVVYSPWLQPLCDCFSYLQTNRLAVNLQVHESWLRPYQVLPMRSHPHMVCSGTGGFMLTGIVVKDCAPPPKPPSAQGGEKRKANMHAEREQKKMKV